MCDHSDLYRAIKKRRPGAPTNLPISSPRPNTGSLVFTKIRKWVLTQKCHFSVTPKKVPISAYMCPILDFRHDIESEGLGFICQIHFQKIMFFSFRAFGQKSKFHFFIIYPLDSVLGLIFWPKRV